MALGGAEIMWKYVKSLEYPVNIKKKDLRMAKYLVTQYGGANGELAAAWRYLNQRYTMPDEKGKALLNDIGTEEYEHLRYHSLVLILKIKLSSYPLPPFNFINSALSIIADNNLCLSKVPILS